MPKNGKNGRNGKTHWQSDRRVMLLLNKIREGWAHSKCITYAINKWEISKRWALELVNRAECIFVEENESTIPLKVSAQRARLFKLLKMCETQARLIQKETTTRVLRRPGRRQRDDEGNPIREQEEIRVVEQKQRKLTLGYLDLYLKTSQEIAKLDGLNRPELFENVSTEQVKLVKMPLEIKKKNGKDK